MSGLLNKLHIHRHHGDKTAEHHVDAPHYTTPSATVGAPHATVGAPHTTVGAPHATVAPIVGSVPVVSNAPHTGVSSTTVVSAPIIEETVRQDRLVQIQPVVHRDVEKTVVHHVERHVQEAPAANAGGVVGLEPVVIEHVHVNHVTEVHTIVHRPGAAPFEYTGLNVPYTGGSAHPQYGYMRLTPDKKAARFEQKALEYERTGNMVKAQKNREKAARYLSRTQPGYVRPVRPQTYYVQRADLFNQRALQYQQLGMQPQYQRYAGRAQRVRAKHGLPAYGPATVSTGAPGFVSSTGVPLTTTTYQGLNYPYDSATAHPQYGYMRLTPDKKAARFEQKALQYERKGNMAKAQKNREKAARYLSRTQPGYVRPVRPQTYYVQRADLFNQRALQYQQMGMQPQYQRYAGRAQRVRTKHSLPAYAPVF